MTPMLRSRCRPFGSAPAPVVWLSSGTSLLTQIRHQPFGSAPALAFWLSSGTSYLTRLRHQLFRSAPAVSLSTSCFTQLRHQLFHWQTVAARYPNTLVSNTKNQIFDYFSLVSWEYFYKSNFDWLRALSEAFKAADKWKWYHATKEPWKHENGTMQPRNHESMKMVPYNQGAMKPWKWYHATSESWNAMNLCTIELGNHWKLHLFVLWKKVNI